MNYRLVSKVLGALLLLIALAMAVCTAYAWFQRDWAGGRGAFRALATSLGITTGAAVLLLILGRKSGTEILRKEAIVIVGGGWLLSAIFGAIPYALCTPTNLTVVDAFFESMSGFTTTGSTVITDLDPFPESILLWRSLTQWLGGLGILVLFVALLAYLGVSSKMLMRHESSLELGEGKNSRIRSLAMRLWMLYIGLTVSCTGILYLYGVIVEGVDMSWFDAVLHAFTAVATGGFSPYNASVGHFDSVGVEVILMTFMVVASLNFLILLCSSELRTRRHGSGSRRTRRVIISSGFWSEQWCW